MIIALLSTKHNDKSQQVLLLLFYNLRFPFSFHFISQEQILFRNNNENKLLVSLNNSNVFDKKRISLCDEWWFFVVEK